MHLGQQLILDLGSGLKQHKKQFTNPWRARKPVHMGELSLGKISTNGKYF